MKKLLWALLILLMGLILLYFYRYKWSDPGVGFIPRDAQAAVNVNLRQLEHHFLMDVLSDPLQLFPEKKNTASDSVEPEVEQKHIPQGKLMDFVKLPSTFTMYQMAGSGSWQSNPHEIKEPGIGKYLTDAGYMKSSDDGRVVYRRGSISFILNKDQLFIVYGKTPEKNWYDYKEDTSPNQALSDALRNTAHDVAYANINGDQLLLDFDHGEIHLGGKVSTPLLRASALKVSREGILGFAGNFDMEEVSKAIANINTDKFTNFTKLNVDSLLTFWSGEAELVLDRFNATTETITTYEYDDDFNKVAKDSTITKSEPDYYAKFSTDGALAPYLMRQNAVKVDEGDSILTIMPLVRTRVQSSSKALSILAGSRTSASTETTEKMLDFYWDIQAFKSGGESVYSLPTFLKAVEHITISISESGEVTGSIETRGESNALVALMK